MIQYSQEEINAKYKLLPEELKDFLSSAEEVDMLNEICIKHELLNQFMDIQKNIAFVTLGLLNFNDFKNYIFSIAKNESSGQIAYQQIFNMIFLPIMHLINREAPETIAPEIPKPQKNIEPQENIPFINEANNLIETPPTAKTQNSLEQIRAIKSMDRSQIEKISQYNQNDEDPNTRRSFDSYREPIE